MIQNIEELYVPLGDFIISRQHEVSRWKLKNLLSIAEIQKYGEASEIKEVNNILDGKVKLSPKKREKLNQVTRSRNHLMLVTCLINATRSSNLANMTLYDVENATLDTSYNAFCVRSENYKTSLLYGDKLMLFPNDIFLQLQFYIKELRPVLTDDANKKNYERYVFTSSRASADQLKKQSNQKMTSSLVASSCASAFSLSGVSKR